MIDRRFLRLTLAAAAAVVAAAAAAQVELGQPSGPDPRIAAQIRLRLEQTGTPAQIAAGDEPIYGVTALRQFYAQREYQPAWITGELHLPLARDLVRALREAENEGLCGDDYHLTAIETLLARVSRAQSASPGDASDLELLLSDAFLIYGAHLVSGRINPETFDPEWIAVRREVDLITALADALAARRPRAALLDLLPTDPGYALLREGLSRYRSFPPWPAIPEVSQTLHPGDRDERLPELRRRLAATGDLEGSATTADEELFDADVEQAVRRFQERHGLEVDGNVGKNTLAALNVPLADRIRQIELNLERWRWLPRDLGDRFVLVNIPGYSLQVIEDEQPVLDMRVVVGRAYRRTPVMSDTIRYLVLNPYWEVPATIAVQDKLPEVRKDPEYFAKMKIRVFTGWGEDAQEIDPASVDWTQVSRRNFPYRLRQDPGPLNALGRIKFMFPNKFNVYLHDTPSRELFRRAERDFSSGCIRIEKPLELAEYLLRDAPAWNRAALEQAIASMEAKTISLPRPIAVHLQYWTAWVDPDGRVHLRSDLYGRDSQLAAALAAPAPAG